MRNYYIIIYTMKKHNFTWISVLNCLIGLLSFFCLSSQEHIMIEHTFFGPFIQHYFNIQEIIQITRMDYDKTNN